MASLQLDIVTPDQRVLSKQVEEVYAPGLKGMFGVLPGHVPFISALCIGALHYKADGKTYYVFVAGGFSEISDNKVTILAESAETADCIDYARAEASRKRAQQRLEEKVDSINTARATAAMSRATARLSLHGKL